MGVYIVAIIGATVVISRVLYHSAFIMGYQIVTTEPKHEAEVQAEPKFFEEVVLEALKANKCTAAIGLLRRKKLKALSPH